MTARRFEDIIAKFDDKTAALALLLRAFLFREMKSIMEFPDPKLSLVGYGFAEGYKHLICTMMISKLGIKLGLTRGAELEDPLKLLEGSGKVHKYIVIKDEKTLQNPAVKQLLHATMAAYKNRIN